MLILGITSYNISRTVIQEEVSNYIITLMIEQTNYLDLLLESVESLIANISGVEDIKNVLDSQLLDDTYTKLATRAEIGYILNGYLNLKGLVAIDIFTLTGNHFHVGDTLDTRDIDNDLLDSIYDETLTSDRLVLWTGVEDNINLNSIYKKVIIAAKTFSVIDAESLQERPIGIILVSYSTKSLYEHFSQFDLGEGAYAIIIDTKNRLIYHPNKKLIGLSITPTFLENITGNQGSFVTTVDNKSMLVTYNRSTISDWLIISLVPVNTLTTHSDIIRNVTIGILFISFIFIGLGSSFISRFMIEPIKAITNLFQQIETGNFASLTRFKTQRTDEINDLLHWFNTFLDSLEEKRQAEIALIQAKDESEIARKEAEVAQERAEVANRAKSIFLSSMSHELRTPLNGVLGYVQILERDKTLNQSQKEKLAIIRQSGNHLLGLINDVLDFSKIEAERMELLENDISFISFLKNIVAMLSVRANNKKLYLNLELDPDLPIAVRTDEKRLRQVLINVINNAIKFTEKGGVTFLVRCYMEKIRFQITDTGIGIPQDNLEDIFSPFKQVGHGSLSTEGTGLGLAISHKLTQLLGSDDLHVSSKVGEGTTFWFDLSLSQVEGWKEKEIIEEKVIGYKGEQHKILIVDDVPHNCGILVNTLEPLGFLTEIATNGQEGVDKTHQFEPDLILMDLVMPVMNGLVATQQIKKTYPHVKVFIVSASSVQNLKDVQTRTASNDYLQKPIIMNLLFDKMAKHLGIEWIYETIADSTAEESMIDETAMIPPPTEYLETLLELAEMFSFKKIKAELKNIRALDSDYENFVQQVESYVKTFDADDIFDFVEQFLEN